MVTKNGLLSDLQLKQWIKMGKESLVLQSLRKLLMAHDTAD